MHTMHLQCVLLCGPHFVASPGITWLSNAPTSKNQVGWGLETSEATPEDHDNQSNDLKTANLTIGTLKYQYT